MKKNILFTFVLLCLLACKESNAPSYTLEGRYGNGNDTLLIFGTDSRHDCIDTLLTDKEGAFGYTLETDTIIPLVILLPDGKLHNIYAEPHTKAKMFADTLNNGTYKIAGGRTQFMHDSITARLDSIGEKSQIYKEIDKFIEEHPFSDINLQLLMKYFVEIEEPKSALIRERITNLGGTLQDNEHIIRLKELTDKARGNILHKAFPVFEIMLADSSKRVLANYHNKYLIVTFWASWDSASVERMRKFRDLKATKDTAHLALLNISLDYDTVAWRKCLATDSVPGDNTCDTRMWNNKIAENFTISKLPFSILVNPYQRIEKFDMTNDEMEQSMDSLIEKLKSDIKKRKEREARNKKR